jgi:hypothetical protein
MLFTNAGSPKVAYCQTSKWVWDQSPCPIAKLPTSKLRSTYAGKRVLFVGDSEIRNVYHQFVAILDPSYQVRACVVGVSLAARGCAVNRVPHPRTCAPLHHVTIYFEVPRLSCCTPCGTYLCGFSLTHLHHVHVQANASALAKHSDIHYAANFDKTLTVDFVWAPMVANVTTALRGKLRTQPGTHRSNPVACVLCCVFHIRATMAQHPIHYVGRSYHTGFSWC